MSPRSISTASNGEAREGSAASSRASSASICCAVTLSSRAVASASSRFSPRSPPGLDNGASARPDATGSRPYGSGARWDGPEAVMLSCQVDGSDPGEPRQSVAWDGVGRHRRSGPPPGDRRGRVDLDGSAPRPDILKRLRPLPSSRHPPACGSAGRGARSRAGCDPSPGRTSARCPAGRMDDRRSSGSDVSASTTVSHRR